MKNKIYTCHICNVSYSEKLWVDRCKNWCKSHNNTCNLEIVKHATRKDVKYKNSDDLPCEKTQKSKKNS